MDTTLPQGALVFYDLRSERLKCITSSGMTFIPSFIRSFKLARTDGHTRLNLVPVVAEEMLQMPYERLLQISSTFCGVSMRLKPWNHGFESNSGNVLCLQIILGCPHVAIPDLPTTEYYKM